MILSSVHDFSIIVFWGLENNKIRKGFCEVFFKLMFSYVSWGGVGYTQDDQN